MGLDKKATDGMIELGIEYCIIESDKGFYKTALKNFQDYGFVLDFKPHRPQYFLEERYFEKIKEEDI